MQYTAFGALLWATVLSVMLTKAYGARILAVLPFPGKSHNIFQNAILRALAHRGHQIVEYSPFPPMKPIERYSHVEIHTSVEHLFNNLTFKEIERQLPKGSVFGLGALGIWKFSNIISEESFQHENMRKLVESKDHFDLVITASTFESMLVFGHKFNAPTIVLQAFAYSSTLNREAGNALSIASVPDSSSFLFTNQMSFIERLQNFISVSLTQFYYYYSQLGKQDAIVKKYYQFPDTPNVAEMVSNVSIYLLNTYPAIDPQPYTPNIIPIGGISVTTDRIILPQDIKEFMDNATEGVVYFSFGTIVSAYELPKEVLNIFVNVFRKISQKVLWKIDTEVTGLSNNVKAIKWAPQIGVLDHPNCRAFITHGGLNSQLEAIYTGVPTIGVPFFMDQPYNVRFNEHRGIGVKIDLKDLSEESLLAALISVLNNPKYKQNAQQLSLIFRDRPVSPADSVVFWVEYVLRHEGAHHLRSAATRLSWYQLALLDILAVVVGVVVILCLFLWRMLLCVIYKIKMSKIVINKKNL